MAVITNAAGTNTQDVNAAGEAAVRLPSTPTSAAPIYLVGKPDTNSASISSSVTSSTQGLLGTANPVIEFDQNFYTSAINSSVWSSTLTTFTTGISAGIVTLNNGGSTAAAGVARLTSYKNIRVSRGQDVVIGWRAKLDQAPITNNVVEIGAFIAATTAAPTAGAFFRIGTDGTLQGIVIDQSGSELSTGAITLSTPTIMHDYIIVIGQSAVTFEIDNIPVASVAIAGASSSMLSSESVPFAARIYNSSSTGIAQKLYISRCVGARFGGSDQIDGLLLSAARGDVGIQHVVGTGTGGTHVNWANSAVPATATLSNTAAGYTTLGGQFLFVAVAGAETDYALFGFQVPAGSISNMGRQLLVHGIDISSYVSVAGATVTTANVLQWGVAFGSTAVSLATAEAVTTKLPRRNFVGQQSFPTTAIVGSTDGTISKRFVQPLPVNPGEFFHVILKIPAGAATTFPTIRGFVAIDATWN